MSEVSFPLILKPFSKSLLKQLQEHVRHIRLLYDWPGHRYEASQSIANNAWSIKNVPLLFKAQFEPTFCAKVSKLAKTPLKPSRMELIMFGPDGELPKHQAEKQSQFVCEMVVHADGDWSCYYKDQPYLIKPAEAILYKNEDEVFERPQISETPTTKVDVIRFHFVSTDFGL